ncbi:MAG: energy-coupling factor transporter transmembrane protein EcfT [Firmicutes bacterium]|nr:energy-coupling factor transporter transmembrane protein EcfT [Bacillota bacterium]
MLKDITIGQYYSVDSVIHRLDPRTKIIGTFFFIVILFVIKGIYGLLLAGLLLLLVVKAAKVPLSYIVRGQKSIMFLLMFTVVLNMLMVKGEVLVQVWFLKITREGIYTAVFMAIRLILLVIGCSLMTLTTTPLQLTDGLERLLRPLKKIKVPVHDISMMMSIALRFIPILMEETDKIMKAQSARGADFDSGGLVQKAKALIPVLVPLVISAFRRADELATAMEARCYRGDEGRTRMKELRYKKQDYVAKVVVVAACVGLYMARFLPSVTQTWQMITGIFS